MMQDWHMGWGGGWGGMGVGPVLWIALVILLVVGLVTFMRMTTSGGERPSRDKTAREILDERFARGEIDQAEYASRRDQLER